MSHDGYTYPTEAQEDVIRRWGMEDGRPATPETWASLLDYVKSLWWNPNWGWSEFDDGNERHYIVSTGGWSGNEGLVSALESNPLFGTFCFEANYRGGHYHWRVQGIVPVAEPA